MAAPRQISFPFADQRRLLRKKMRGWALLPWKDSKPNEELYVLGARESLSLPVRKPGVGADIEPLVKNQLEAGGAIPEDLPPGARETIVWQADRNGLCHGSATLTREAAEKVSEKFDGYGLSALCLEIPASHIAIWKEQGRLVLGVAHEVELLHFQILGTSRIDTAALAEVRSVLFGLEISDLLPEIQGACIWVPTDQRELSKHQISEALGMRCVFAEEPALKGSIPSLSLLPARAAERRNDTRKRRRTWRNVFLFLCFLGLLIGGVWFLKKMQDERLADKRAALADLDAQTAQLVEKQRRYQHLEAAIDPQNYPLEVLRRVRLVVPDQTVRVSSLEIKEDAASIVLETTSPTDVYEVAERIRAQLDAPETLGPYTFAEPEIVPAQGQQTTSRLTLKGTLPAQSIASPESAPSP